MGGKQRYIYINRLRDRETDGEREIERDRQREIERKK